MAGSFLDPREEITLIIEPEHVDAAVRCCVRIGLDHVRAVVSPEALSRAFDADLPAASIEEIAPDEAARRLSAGESHLLDVRGRSEYAAVRITGAQNIPHTRLAAHLEEVPNDRSLVVQCLGGARSAASASLLARHGYRVANLAGGITAWQRDGQPTES